MSPSKLFRCAHYLSWALFLFVLIFLPTRTAHEFLGSYAELTDKVYGFVVFVSFIALLFFFCAEQIFSYKGRPPGSKKTGEAQYSTPSTTLLYIQIALSVLIFIRTASQINATLDWDENETISSISSGDTFFVVNPLRGSTNHPLASLASSVSMKIFGVSKWTARLPALGFTLLFLILLNLFCIRFATPFVTIAVFVHLLCNEMAIWYMHSMRGYIPMMLFTFGAFFVVYSFTQGYAVSKRQHIFFFLMLLLAPLSHTIGYLFCVILTATLCFWLFFQGDHLTESQLKDGRKLLLAPMLALALLATFAIFQMAALNSERWIISSEPVPDWQYERNFARISMVFGVAKFWIVKLLSLPVLILFLRQLKERRASIRNFDALFLCLSFFFFAMSVWLLKAIILEGRMLMPFLVIFVLWLSNSVETLSPTLLRNGVSLFLLACLTIPQIANSYSLLHDDLEFFGDQERFAESIKARLAKDTELCVSLAGDPSAILYAKNIYLKGLRFVETNERCAVHYLAYYSLGRFEKKYELKAPIESLNPIFDDQKGRYFYEMLR